MSRILDTIRNDQIQPWAERVILAALCAILLGQLFFGVRQISQTADEATHMYSGYRYLVCGDLTISPEHPPLAKIVAAAPILPMNLAVDCAPFKGDDVTQAITSLNWLYSQNWQTALSRARTAISVFALGLCVLVWIATRRMFGLATAVVATVLVIFEPNVLAFGGLVMTDVPVTCMMLFAVYAFYLWVNRRTAPFLLLTGLATGLTLLAKHTGVLVVPILCGLAVVDALIDHASAKATLEKAFRNLLAVALVCTIAFGVVWAGYGMRFAAHPGAVQFSEAGTDATSSSTHILSALKRYHALPEAYLEGFAQALSISSQSGPVFVAGKIYSRAPWFSALVNLLIRTTMASWVLLLVSLVGLATAFKRQCRELLFVLVPAVVFLAACLRANMNVGSRYLLPMFPLVLIAVAAGCVELARRAKWLRYAVPCLLLLHAASSLHSYPNYLSYANELWGGPRNAYKYLSWLDIGQAYPEAKAYLERHPAETCWFITGWQWNPTVYGVRCNVFGAFFADQIPPRIHGTVMVSSTLLTDVRPVGELVAPFKDIAPKDKIGGSALLVYEGDFDTRLAAAFSERVLMAQAYKAGQRSVALVHGERAVELAPDSASSHIDLCLLLTWLGHMDSALQECSVARTLALRDPLREEPGRKLLLGLIEAELTQLKIRYSAAHRGEAVIEPSAPRTDPK